MRYFRLAPRFCGPPLLRATAAEAAAKKGSEKIFQVDIEAAAVEAAKTLAVDAGMTILVVNAPFFLVAEHSIGFIGLLELGLGLLVSPAFRSGWYCLASLR